MPRRERKEIGKVYQEKTKLTAFDYFLDVVCACVILMIVAAIFL
ncbi:hypothetical protein [uncultured Roseobacter sp.]|nr:hypothetical protein [uncultured Roseobacter sp.]